MTENVDAEHAYYFRDLSARVFRRAVELCPAASDASPIGRHNPCGVDLEQSDLDLIDAVFSGRGAGLSRWQVAQVGEMVFWREVAFRGYAGIEPRLFPFHTELLMVTTFYRTGWAMEQFRAGSIVEIGCGPLGMIEYLPAARRVAFDPLNDRYGRLFANFRSGAIDYLSDRDLFVEDPTSFDLGICHNVIDHTKDPAAWFNTLFAKIKAGGRFIFQVNLSEADTPQQADYRRMHPSPVTFAQIIDWFGEKSDDFRHFREAQASQDGEFYFLCWGTKCRDRPVAYRNLIE